ncbi:MAG: DUF262 domain-containing protein [Muribaculaceae bacterium]|nr:DUF262 domain-containing protein [Muribaculaceae bacterium]
MDKKTFPELFSFTDENKTTKDIPLVIPMIQRDYAQGRSSAEEIRKSFVKALYDALSSNQEINLDFVYGSYENIDDNKAFIPLDGQQRLTTLFLLYWLIIKKEKIEDNVKFLERFTYKTRHTTRAFCDFLTHKFIPEFEHSLSFEIKEDPQFILLWENDPTVKGMLVMLDELNQKFYGNHPDSKYWDRLPNITFFFADLDELGISDEIYIKMNSRGKPLTPFEHFKAELDSIISNADFSEKVDTVWTDVFWRIRDENGTQLPVVDDAFLRYVHFVANIICLKESGLEAPADHFEMIKDVFLKKENQMLLEKSLDAWVELDSDKFFESWFIENQPSGNSFLVNIHQSVNLLKKLSKGEEQNMRNVLLLWGCIVYITNKESISETEFRTRIRVLRNLTFNSEYEFRKERYTAIVTETEELILFGTINLETNSFNQQQKVEEAQKLEWIRNNDEKHELILSSLENNNLLLGSTCLIGTDNYDYFDTFNNTFKDSLNEQEWIEVSKALLTYGDIAYRENSWRVLVPGKNSGIWRSYFGPNTHSDFRKRATSAITGFLKDSKNGLNRKQIVENWIQQQDHYDWRYYFIKYPIIIQKSQYGKYWFPGDKKGCHFYAMHTPLSTSGRHWEGILLALSNEKGWSLGDYGNGLMLEGTNKFLINERHQSEIKESEDENQTKIIETINIENDHEYDLVDRVEFLRLILRKYR